MNDIFSIFNPDWWMDENNNALQMTDAVLFLLLAIPVAYLFIYALASLRKYKNPYPPSPKRHRFLVLFVVLKNGKILAQGTQEQLLADCPLYKDMWEAHIGAKDWAVATNGGAENV